MPATLRSLSPLVWAAAILAALLIITLTAHGQARARAELAAARANAVIRDRDTAAREAAADARLADAAANTALKEDLSHAVENLPDAVPSARRIAMACARLRLQGTDTAALPACLGPQSRGQAAP